MKSSVGHSPITLSIIIPAHNEAARIGTCLQSILSQKDIDTEVIVVDNNSTDATARIARALKVRILHAHTPGAAAARNYGARHARGRWYLFIDADCIAPQGLVRRVKQYVKNHPQIQMVGGPFIFIDGPFWLRMATAKGFYFFWYHTCLRYLYGVQTLSSGIMAVKKSAFLTIGGFDRRINNVIQAEDLDFCCRFAQLGLQARIDRSLYLYTSARRQTHEFWRTAIVRTYWALYHLIRHQPYRLGLLASRTI